MLCCVGALLCVHHSDALSLPMFSHMYMSPRQLCSLLCDVDGERKRSITLSNDFSQLATTLPNEIYLYRNEYRLGTPGFPHFAK